MATHVLLDIVPQRIHPAAWAEVWDEVRALLAGQPLYGYDWITAAGVALPVYTRSVERDADDPAARRLTVAGDRATLAFGAPQTILRDLGHYLGRFPPGIPRATPPDDVLLAAAGVDHEATDERPPPPHPVPRAPQRRTSGHVCDGVVQVLGDAPCTDGCAIPLLGAAMLVEARFPRHALVHGDIDRDRAEAARRWAEGALGRPVALPVRVDAWRLSERLGTRLRGSALFAAVRRLHLATPARQAASLIALFGRAEAEPWWIGEIGLVAGDRAATRALLGGYLEATRDLPRLCGLMCLDARGPRWSPEALVTELAALRLDASPVAGALCVVFGGGAPRLATMFRALRDTPDPPEPTIAGDDRAGLATLGSPADLSPSQRAHILDAASLVRALGRRLPHAGARWPEGLAARLAQHGPTLTEDAWAWILREEDPSMHGFLMALSAIDLDGEIRRALFENRALCRYAAAAAGDEA